MESQYSQHGQSSYQGQGRPQPQQHQWGSRSVDIFEKLEQIGEGTYGQVYRCRNKETGEIVALKKVRMDNEKEGFPITAIREIKILRQLDDANVIKLKEIVTSGDMTKTKGSIYMVFEYMDHDLTGLMDTPGLKFSAAQIKCYMQQLLCGLHYCHKNNVLHRDIKGSNLLINNKGILKLADFGLARPYNDQMKDYTNRVITLWYRPPELLLGATSYGPAIDMWSVGCIFAELLTRKPIFPGRNEIDQLDLIFRKCGSPAEENWIEGTALPWYHMFKPAKPFPRRLREELKPYKEVSPEAFDLIDKLLSLDPKKRITASDALDSEYFWKPPLPCDPSSLPLYPPSHEYQTKKRRQQLKQEQQQQPQLTQGPSSGSSQGGAGQHHGPPPHHSGAPPGPGGGAGSSQGRRELGPPPPHHMQQPPNQHPPPHHNPHYPPPAGPHQGGPPPRRDQQMRGGPGPGPGPGPVGVKRERDAPPQFYDQKRFKDHGGPGGGGGGGAGGSAARPGPGPQGPR